MEEREKSGGRIASCIIYLDLLGEKELPHPFKRLKINQQSDNLSRHGAFKDQPHTCSLLFILKKNFMGKVCIFCIFYRVYSSMYLHLEEQENCFVIKL